MELNPTRRIASIDILRGAVMIIMALDHTRDFFHQPAMLADPLNAATTTIPIYFTRWITHFCAPVFVFLSGMSAYLSSRKKTKAQASSFLIKRGLFLVLLEITVVTFGITLNPQFNFIIFQVIFAIGCSMIVLGILSSISRQVILIAGILLFFGHNILDYLDLSRSGTEGVIWNLFFRASNSAIPLDENHIILDLYAILPWTGAMLMGFSIAHWFRDDFPAEKRRKYLFLSGLTLISLFIILRVSGWYGDPRPWIKGEGFVYNMFTFLDTNKYPPSLQYLSMTLGPACLILAVLEKARGGWTNIVSVYGRAPLFYYVLHFYLIHVFLIIIFYASGYTSADIRTPGLPFLFRPLEFGYGLPVVYLIWLAVVATLYLPTKWYTSYKKNNKKWWLSYI